MNENTSPRRRPSWAIAFCAILSALGAVLMIAGGLIPAATYLTPMMAAALLLAVLAELGKREAWMVWAVTAALSLMLTADKEAGFLYLFIGYYPILRGGFDRIRPRGLSILAKLLFFAASVGTMYALLIFVFQLNALMEDFGDMAAWMAAVFFAALVGLQLIFDLALRRLDALYRLRLRPRLKILNRG